MRIRTSIGLVLQCLVLTASRAAAQETQAQHDARMSWWRDARFGMFIHWGAYAVPGGVYHGDRMRGTAEWIMNSGHVPIPEYETFVHAFNPVDYDPDAWVRIAKDAGMKYIIITSKHHEGFAIFDSKVSSYDIVDATPYKRDALKALADAAHRQGMKFGVYYSIMDWHHPDAQGPHYPNHNADTTRNPNFRRYVETYMKPQLKELVTQYPSIDVLWFDGEWISDWNDELGREVYDYLRAIRPGLIINNRVGHTREGMSGFNKDKKGGLGDFGTPEQEVPAQGLPGLDWETCMTMNDTWGFSSFDDNWKDTKSLVRTLIDVASKGGNLLLNVGPTSRGVIPHESVARLREMGDWMRVNGEAIYGTTASPFDAPAWGRFTAKPGRVYAHIFNWPRDGKLAIDGMKDAPLRAYLLADRKPVTITRGDAGLVVQLPNVPPSAIATVLVLETGTKAAQ